jgi:hypothetical protein
VTGDHEPAFWSSRTCRWLAGADAGVAAACAVLVWLPLHCFLRGQHWWASFNIAAAPFYGDRVFTAGPGVVTATGAACLLLAFAALGAVIGRLTPAPPHWYRSLTVAMLASFVVYLSAHFLFWPRVHPFAPSYFSPSATLPAFLIFALMMVRLGRRYLALMIAFGGLVWPPPPVEPPPEAPDPAPESAATSVLETREEPLGNAGSTAAPPDKDSPGSGMDC